MYLAWDPLNSSELKGYNLYYSAVSGQYLQRRSLPPEATNIAIRALPLDTTYYFAIRGVNQGDEESAFSKEVAVKVGSPNTATAPLSMKDVDGPQGKNPIRPPRDPASNVPGETGISSMLLLLLIAGAIIGTAFAFRRQATVSVHP